MNGERDRGTSDSRRREGNRIHEHQRLPAALVYQVVSDEGKKQLGRPYGSLWWSGVAAGFAISLSLYTMGLLHLYLPDAGWQPLAQSFGYPVGFLVLIYGRLQLFTQDTITPVLPLMADYSHQSLARMLTLWSVVLLGNLVGTLVVAALSVYAEPGTSAEMAAVIEVAEKAFSKTALTVFLRAIPAGFLIAVMVWMLPNGHRQEFFVIVPITYIIALGQLPNVVVEASKGFVLLFAGETTWHEVVALLLPALAGNTVGGTAIFALLAYGQVKREIAEG